MFLQSDIIAFPQYPATMLFFFFNCLLNLSFNNSLDQVLLHSEKKYYQVAE